MLIWCTTTTHDFSYNNIQYIISDNIILYTYDIILQYRIYADAIKAISVGVNTTYVLPPSRYRHIS